LLREPSIIGSFRHFMFSTVVVHCFLYLYRKAIDLYV
jgi:hypothetical protein